MLVNNLYLKAEFEGYQNCLNSRSMSSHLAISFGHCLAKCIKIIYTTSEPPKNTISPL